MVRCLASTDKTFGLSLSATPHTHTKDLENVYNTVKYRVWQRPWGYGGVIILDRLFKGFTFKWEYERKISKRKEKK